MSDRRRKTNPQKIISQQNITRLNQSRQCIYKPQNTGSMRSTLHLYETLKVQNGREINHAIKLAGNIKQQEKSYNSSNKCWWWTNKKKKKIYLKNYKKDIK